MKNTLTRLLLAIAIILPAVAFGGLVGLFPPAVFAGAEIALFAFAFISLTLIGLGDTGGARRPLIVRRSQKTPVSALNVSLARRRCSYGLRHEVCAAA
jgi:hypothetical protein